jgi:hypothetical protein
MSIADELQKLEELRRHGSLSEDEFARAKALLLSEAACPAAPPGRTLADPVSELRYQNELARVDREWAMEREKYFVAGRYGRRQLPTKGMGVGVAAVSGVFGVMWTILAIVITGSAPDFGPFAVAKVVFPLFGVGFVVAGISFGAYCYSRSQEYEKAHAAYQSRRNAIRPEHFHSA